MTRPRATERRSHPRLLVVVGPGVDDVEVGRAAEDGRRVHDARSVDVEVHPSPLRQVVVGAPSRRRPVVDTVPL